MVIHMTDVALCTVKPLHTTPHLEFIPIMSNDVFFPVFFAYRLPNNSQGLYSSVVNKIKASLQKVLVPFYGFPGRCIDTLSPTVTNRQLLCNNAGIPFIEAYVDADLDSVVQASAAFQPVTELQGHSVLGMNNLGLKQWMLPEGLPCIFVQVTRFKCGGLTVAVTFNHCHTDDHRFFTFMRAWSDLCRMHTAALKPHHSRDVMEIEELDLIRQQIRNPSLHLPAQPCRLPTGWTAIRKPFRHKLETTKIEEWLELERLRETIEAFDNTRFAAMTIFSWFNFPLYDIDFGFGKPFFSSGVNSHSATTALGAAYTLPPIPSSFSSIATVHIWSTPEITSSLL